MVPRLLIAMIVAGLQQAAVSDEPKREPIDLPGFEQGDLYVLSRLSNEQLINVERGEWVHTAILIRDGLDRSHRRTAIAELAKLRKTDELTQILDGIHRAGGNVNEEAGPMNDLIGLLMESPSGALKKHHDTLLELATNGEHTLMRQAGYAAMIVADGTVDAAWRLAQTSGEGLVDILNTTSMISDGKTRSSLYPRIEKLIHEAPSRAIRQAAIVALASMPNHSSEVFAMLASLVEEDIERTSAIQALLLLPGDRWPHEGTQPLLENVIEYLRNVDPTQRNTTRFRRARQLGDDLASRLPGNAGREAREALESLGIRTVTVRSVPYSMRYDRVHIVVEAGTPIEITIENPDQWLHNLVIVTPGALEEIGVRASQMLPDSENWNGRQYVPNSEKVLFASRVIKNGQSDTITIVAPDAIGDYPYLCTYPGHWVSMNGILHVVQDVDAWIAENPVKATGSDPYARAFVQDWRLDDLVSSLDQLDKDRSLERGKALFSATSCLACHQVGKVGGVIGPELGEVSKRLNPADMLDAILKPSKTINEHYRISTVVLNDDRQFSGVIERENATMIELVENSQASVPPTKISRDQIVEINTAETSTMPMGLLNTLTREEILDLLAYIRSSGDVQDRKHLGAQEN